ncbi:MAG: NAD(P)H-hydrate dehydratase [Pseudomonadota bacterium]
MSKVARSRPKPLTAAELKRHPLPPVAGGDKDSHGQILIIAGSREVPGAALLAAHGAMRAGAGKLKLGVPDAIAIPLGVAMPEAMVVGSATARDGGFSRRAVAALIDLAKDADAIVAGPGLAANPAATRLAGKLCALGRPLALDAALLHALPNRQASAKAAAIPPILLPHAGEMASLLDCDPAEVEADPLGHGRACANRYDALVLVKGVASHVVAPDGRAWHYPGGGSGLGVSGSGDVLAGIVGGLLARGAAPLSALLWGVWLHGEAGKSLAKEVGPVGYLAREIADAVPFLLRRA